MIALVFSEILRSTSIGSRVRVSLSISAKTTVPPKFRTGRTEAQKVELWDITSSPTPIPHPYIAECTAAVPLFVAKA